MIRNARETDFMSCVRIAHAAWPEFKERESIYHLFCKFFSNTCFVYEDAGTVVAFLLGFISQVDASQAYIHLVAVDPSAQRRGLASELYRRFFETAHGLGATRVRLIVNPDNQGSLAFHRRMGFQVDLHGAIVGLPARSSMPKPPCGDAPRRRRTTRTCGAGSSASTASSTRDIGWTTQRTKTRS